MLDVSKARLDSLRFSRLERCRLIRSRGATICIVMTTGFSIAPYDPLWPVDYAAEADRLAQSCRDLPLRIEHIGSTADPGLSAKPIVDILIGVPPNAARAPYVATTFGGLATTTAERPGFPAGTTFDVGRRARITSIS